ncbi:MAG: hypothetical protein U5N58_08115 [Actinomycetota bacterium]|nr:hypothetical protein [Actinomycetota bacterium]
MPEGYLLIEDYQGQQLKIGPDKSLSQHMGLSPQDARNILAIRNSDLTINLEEEYYRTVDQLYWPADRKNRKHGGYVGAVWPAYRPGQPFQP